MTNSETTPTGKDEALWALAKRRAKFKRSLATYIIFIIFFWLIWYFTEDVYTHHSGIPWPVWAMLGWGIGIAIQYNHAYMNPIQNSVEKEYEKLKNKSS